MKAKKTATAKLSDQEQVTEHIKKIEPALGKIIEPSGKLF